MMKKIIAIILSLAILLCAASAMAEESTGKVRIGTLNINGAFMLQCSLPEGYTVMPTDMAVDHVYATIKSENPDAPVMQLSVYFDEMYSDVDRLNDLLEDGEAMALLEQTFIDSDPDVEITYGETGYGTRLLIARHESETLDYISFFSIYKGYCVDFALVPSEQAEDKNLTDEQMSLSINYLTDLDFIPADQMTIQAQIKGRTFNIANITDYHDDTNEIEVELKKEIVLEPGMLTGMQEGGILRLGQESITVESLVQEEDGSYLINDELELRISGNEARAYLYEREYTETLATILASVEDDLIFLDGIDPETGEPLEEPTVHTGAELISMLTSPADCTFDSENIKVSFDENGKLTTIERYYTPWQ